MLNSTRDDKVETKSDRADSREQFWPSLRSARGFWSQIIPGRSLPRKSGQIKKKAGKQILDKNALYVIIKVMFEFGKTGYLLNELSLYSTTGLFTKTQSAEDATGPKVAGTIFFCQPAPTREQLPYIRRRTARAQRHETRQPAHTGASYSRRPGHQGRTRTPQILRMLTCATAFRSSGPDP